jgi:hypothetical protein
MQRITLIKIDEICYCYDQEQGQQKEITCNCEHGDVRSRENIRTIKAEENRSSAKSTCSPLCVYAHQSGEKNFIQRMGPGVYK